MVIFRDPDWCRAVVESMQPDGSFGIRYIDYGHFDTVRMDKLRTLPESLIELPPLAIKCALDGSGWKSVTLGRCHTALYHKPNLTVKLVNKMADHLFVRFIDPNGVDIITKLGLSMSAAEEEVYVSLIYSSVIGQKVPLSSFRLLPPSVSNDPPLASPCSAGATNVIYELKPSSNSATMVER